MKINDRKVDHLRICIDESVEAGKTGFEDIMLAHKALPEIDYDDIDMSIRFLGKKLNYPLIIEAMTGGVSDAGRINKDVASIAQEYGIGFGVGSQRAAIENPDLAPTYQVRDVAPDILLIGNLGAVQLNYGYSVRECRTAVNMIGADALALHLNPLQEVVQPEGNKNFSGLAAKINAVAASLKKPVIIKETGCGISSEVAMMLKVSAYDVSGAGGTSWSLVEGYRNGGARSKLAERFASWGIPTACAIKELSQSKNKTPIIASGGIRSGVDAAKAIALGADCAGCALPVLKAYSAGGKDGVRKFLDGFLEELKVCMFLTGTSKVKELKGRIWE